MTWVFIAFALFGGAFLLPMLLGGLDVDELELELEAGTELDVDGADVGDLDSGLSSDVAADAGIGSAIGDLLGGLLSLRSLVMFSAFFGTSGLVLEAVGYPGIVGVPTALVIGLFAAVVNSALYGFLARSQVSSHVTDRVLEGKAASVVLPIRQHGKGRVRIDLNGQPQFMVAKSYDDRSTEELEVGSSVVVVQIEQGTALVAPVPELA